MEKCIHSLFRLKVIEDKWICVCPKCGIQMVITLEWFKEENEKEDPCCLDYIRTSTSDHIQSDGQICRCGGGILLPSEEKYIKEKYGIVQA